MKIALIGLVDNYSPKEFCSAHGYEARIVGLASGLAKLGHHVEVAGRHEIAASEPGDFHVVQQKVMENSIPAYNAIVLCGIAGWWNILRWGIADRLAAHPAVIISLDGIYSSDSKIEMAQKIQDSRKGVESLGFLKAAGLNSPQLVVAYQSIHPHQYSFYLPWGCPLVPDNLADPYPYPKKDRIRVIYTGVTYTERHLKVLNSLASDSRIDLWVAAVFSKGGVTKETRGDTLHPNLNLISDIVPYNGNPGPVRYGDTWPFITHADVAININSGPSTDAISTKLYEYLGCGTPIVSEDAVPNAGDIITLKAGKVVKQGGIKNIAEAILSTDWSKIDRKNLKKQALALTSWDRSARLIESALLGR